MFQAYYCTFVQLLKKDDPTMTLAAVLPIDPSYANLQDLEDDITELSAHIAAATYVSA